MVLCIHNSDFSIRNTSLYGSQPSFVAFACKTTSLGPELQVSMGPRPHQWFFAFKRASLAPELQVSMCPRPHPPLCACKTTWLTSELLVSMGPSLHLWILCAKQSLLDHNYKSLLVPALICGFCMQNSDFRTTITSLHGSQTSPMFFCIQNEIFSTRIASLYGS